MPIPGLLCLFALILKRIRPQAPLKSFCGLRCFRHSNVRTGHVFDGQAAGHDFVSPKLRGAIGIVVFLKQFLFMPFVHKRLDYADPADVLLYAGIEISERGKQAVVGLGHFSIEIKRCHHGTAEI